MSKKNTKRALLSSVLALVLCMAMLTGTTFAWFTDSVTSGKNQIVAGNLDVELYHTNSYITTEEKVDGLTNLFTVEEGKSVLWEPGMVVWENFTVKNLGNLALKYELFINFENEVKVSGKGLSDVLKVAVVKDGFNGTREDAKTLDYDYSLASFVLPETLVAGDYDTYGIVIYWEPTDHDNDYNMNNGRTDVLSIDLGVVLQATQVESEKDSFGNDYDAGLLYGDYYATPETLQEIIYAAKPGEIIALQAGEYDKIVLSEANGLDGKNGITLVSFPGAVVGVLDLHRSANVVIDGLTFDAAKTTGTINGLNEAQPYIANITDLSVANSSDGNDFGSHDIVIRNCTFTGTSTDVANYVPICLFERGRSTGNGYNYTIDNCVFDCSAFQYINMSYCYPGTMNITNNTFGGENYNAGHNAINATGNKSDWVITGNNFFNWNPANAVFGSSRTENFVINLTVQNNHFINFSEEDIINVLNLKTSYTAANMVLKYSDNTAHYDTYTFSDTIVNDGNDNLYQMTKKGVNVIPAGTADDLMAALNQAANGDAVVLTQDIDLTGADWFVDMKWQGSGTDIVFDGGNFTITGLECGGAHGGLISKLSTNGNVTIKNLKIKDAVISTTAYADETAGGILIGWLENHGGTITIENITIEGGSVEGYKYSGGLIGYSSSSRPTNVTNCTVSGVTVVNEYAEGASVKGHIGGLSGHHYYGTFTGNTVENVTLVGSTTALRHGALIGSAQANVVIGDGNEVINTTINGTKVTSGTGIGAVDSRTDKSGTVSFS